MPNSLFHSPKQAVFARKTAIFKLQHSLVCSPEKHNALTHNIMRKPYKIGEFPRFTSSGRLQTILAACKWIDRSRFCHHIGFDKMSAKQSWRLSLIQAIIFHDNRDNNPYVIGCPWHPCYRKKNNHFNFQLLYWCDYLALFGHSVCRRVSQDLLNLKSEFFDFLV